MKTITNIIIINSQNVKSEYLLAVIKTPVSKKKALSSSGRVPQKSPTLDCQNCHCMDDLKSLTHQLA